MWKRAWNLFWHRMQMWFARQWTYLLAAPRFIFYLRSIIRKGYHAIETEFEYANLGDTKEKYVIRTFIEIGGDVTNIIPDPYKSDDQNWLFTFQNAYEKHLQRVELFFSRLEASTAFWAFVMMLPFFIGVNYRLVEDIWTWATLGEFTDRLKDQVLDVGILIASVFILPQLIRLLMPRIIAFLIKRVERYLQEENEKSNFK